MFYDSPEDLEGLGKNEVLIINKLNTIGNMVVSLCQNQNQSQKVINIIETGSSNVEILGSFDNRDEELSIFPASSIFEVQQIEEKLLDSRFFAKVAYALSRLGKHTNLSLTVSNILNQLLKWEAGEKFSFLGRSGKKPAFKTLNLCSVVCCAAEKLYPTATKAMVAECIKTWLVQCKNRRQRKNQIARKAAEKESRIFIKLEEHHID